MPAIGPWRPAAIRARIASVPIRFAPGVGSLLLCDFDTGFRPPEMVKRRPVVVISPRRRDGAQLCSVVPLSTSAPERPQLWHCQVRLQHPLPPPYDEPLMWAKADMLATVAFHRLDQFRTRRGPGGQRHYMDLKLPADLLAQIRSCVLHALGLGHLTPPAGGTSL